MNPLSLWATGPFELILHGEEHLINGEDFDRRIALISFDDAIEVSITTYLSLHPIQRGSRVYTKVAVEQWLQNYHTRLDFLDQELNARTLSWKVDRGDIVWAHNNRNEQYHGGIKGIPEKQVLELIRRAALWVFSVLFDVSDTEEVLKTAILSKAPKPSPQRDPRTDQAIDDAVGLVDIAGQRYAASELLFSTDYEAYRAVGQDLSANAKTAAPKKVNARSVLRISS